MSLANIPSFSFILTTSTGVVEMIDRHPGAVSREVRLDLSHLQVPATSVPSSSNRPVDDALMNTIDTRFAGQFAYKVAYEKQRKDGHEDADDLSESGTIYETYSPEQEQAQENIPLTPIAHPRLAPSANERRPRYRPPRSFRFLRLLRALYLELRRVCAALSGRHV